MNLNRRLALILMTLKLLALLAACGSSVPEAATPAPAGYPGPGPTPTVAAYPGPQDLSGLVRIAIDSPVQAGDTVVSGVGPAGLSLQLVNLTFVGTVLGETKIGADGTFSLTVEPLPAGVRVGIVGDLAEVGLTDADILPGEGAFSMPRVGYAFDTVVIPQP